MRDAKAADDRGLLNAPYVAEPLRLFDTVSSTTAGCGSSCAARHGEGSETEARLVSAIGWSEENVDARNAAAAQGFLSHGASRRGAQVIPWRGSHRRTSTSSPLRQLQRAPARFGRLRLCKEARAALSAERTHRDRRRAALQYERRHALGSTCRAGTPPELVRQLRAAWERDRSRAEVGQYVHDVAGKCRASSTPRGARAMATARPIRSMDPSRAVWTYTQRRSSGSRNARTAASSVRRAHGRQVPVRRGRVGRRRGRKRCSPGDLSPQILRRIPGPTPTIVLELDEDRSSSLTRSRWRSPRCGRAWSCRCAGRTARKVREYNLPVFGRLSPPVRPELVEGRTRALAWARPSRPTRRRYQLLVAVHPALLAKAGGCGTHAPLLF